MQPPKFFSMTINPTAERPAGIRRGFLDGYVRIRHGRASELQPSFFETKTEKIIDSIKQECLELSIQANVHHPYH